MWVYIYVPNDEKPFHVGFYDPTGQFHLDDYYINVNRARAIVHYLNGGSSQAIGDLHDMITEKKF